MTGGRGIFGPNEKRGAGPRILRILHVVLFIALVLVSVFPLWQLTKNAFSTSVHVVQHPLSLFPDPVTFSNFPIAWTRVAIGRALGNTVWVAIGSVVVQLIVATMGGYVLGVLRPKGCRLVEILVLATLFVPGIVTLVPSYLVVVRPPWGGTLLNTMWAIWLPAGVSSFNVLLMARFFRGLSREILEAAEVDGAGPVRMFWSIVLPMSRPIVVVITILGLVSSMQGYLWPMLVLSEPSMQPLAVRLPGLSGSSVEPSVYMAALFIAAILPIAVFLLFQKAFLNRDGLAGALKG